jgi:DNA-binding transcriptional LysR family regulator
MAEFQPKTVNLKPLRAFDAVARMRSFSRAATDLGRSQTTISLQIRALERQIGVRLLERTTRQVRLTEAGMKLAEAVETGFRSIDGGLLAARRQTEGRKDRIVLACVPSLSASRLPAILSEFSTRDLRTRIEIEELNASEIVNALLDGRIDLGIGPCANAVPSEVAFVRAVEEPLCAVLGPGWNLDSRAGFRFELLTEVPLVTLSGSVLLQQALEKVARTRGLRLNSAAEVRHVGTAIEMARAGIGVAVVPRLSLPDTLSSDLILSPIIDPPMSRRVGVLTLRDKTASAEVGRMARHIHSALSRLLRRARFTHSADTTQP